MRYFEDKRVIDEATIIWANKFVRYDAEEKIMALVKVAEKMNGMLLAIRGRVSRTTVLAKDHPGLYGYLNQIHFMCEKEIKDG